MKILNTRTDVCVLWSGDKYDNVGNFIVDGKAA